MVNSSGVHPPHSRPSTKTLQRVAAATLAVPLLLLSAACGSDDEAAPAPVASVSGKPGQQPKITASKGAKAPDQVVAKTVTEGKGATVHKDDFVRLDFAYQTLDGQAIGSTWSAQARTKGKSASPQLVGQATNKSTSLVNPGGVFQKLVGQKVGSRVEVEGTAKTFYGEQMASQVGLKPTQGLVFVADIKASKKVDPKATVTGKQAAPESGLPTVKADGQKAATITVPKGEKAPGDLKQQTLIHGKGPEVKAGQALVVQYTGVKWEDGKTFDSSWKNGGATGFQIGTGSVIKGWDQGLVGKHVGDRVLLVIPPKLGYGDQAQSGLSKNTLVFSVDILAAF
ncbi:FKBP-type peptidyl-prolyl cis-trans isomerase [Streptomyces sp. NPDC059740]|uniref:FKBP-type peptidyl-prolyl cis-trans isomerase n=1 Tax=Streptomyces sp. NPDC059740 TaxID=3346926 RepID=UPI00364AF9C4